MATLAEPGAGGRVHKGGLVQSDGEENIVLVQNLPAMPDVDVRARFAAFGTVVWCNPVAPGCYLVRYLQKDAVLKAVHVMDGSMWRGAQVAVQPYDVAPLNTIADSLPSRQESISAILEPEHLAYLDSILTDESFRHEQHAAMHLAAAAVAATHQVRHGLQPQQHAMAGGLPDLVACAHEWAPPGADAALCHALEGLAMQSPRSSSGSGAAAGQRASMDSVHTFSPRMQYGEPPGSPGQGASQLWSQKSIGSAARHDLAKFAALQSLANSQHHVQGSPGSPWGAVQQQQQVQQVQQVVAQHAVAGLPPYHPVVQRGFAEPRASTPESPFAGMHSGPSPADVDLALMMEEARGTAAHHWLRGGAATPGSAVDVMSTDGRSSYGGSGASSPAPIHHQRMQPTNQWSPGVSPRINPAMHSIGSPSNGRIPASHARAPGAFHQGPGHTPSLLGTQPIHMLTANSHFSRTASPADSARDSARGEPHGGGFQGGHEGVLHTLNLNGIRGTPAPPPRDQQQYNGPSPFPHQQPSPPPGTRPHMAPNAGSFMSASHGATDIISDLLELLNNGGADGNPCLLVLRDLLSSAVAGGQQLDAAAFLGLLQEATAVILSATAAPAPAGSGHVRHGSAGGAEFMADGRMGLAPVRARVAGAEGTGSTRTSMAGVGSPMAAGSPSHQSLTPQELASARSTLLRLMDSAHQMILHSPAFAAMCALLVPVADLYDRMHDLPVVQKRKRCQEMAVHRDRIAKEPAFTKAMQQSVTLRNHIYSLSRKVLMGHGCMDGLPLDLFLGGLASELAHILKEQPEQDGSGSTATAVASSPAVVLQPHVAEFYTAMPHPRLALLVFAEFVPVDPQPTSINSLISGTGGGAIDAISIGGSGDSGSNGGGGSREGNAAKPRGSRGSGGGSRSNGGRASGGGRSSSLAGAADGSAAPAAAGGRQ